MFDVGFWEIILVLVIALLVAGPERLPGIVRSVGLWTGRAKAVARQLREEFEREVARTTEDPDADTESGGKHDAKRNAEDPHGDS